MLVAGVKDMKNFVGLFGDVEFSGGLVDGKADDVDESGILDGQGRGVKRGSRSAAFTITKALHASDAAREYGFVEDTPLFFGKVKGELCRRCVERKGRDVFIALGESTGGGYDDEGGFLEGGKGDFFEKEAGLVGVSDGSVKGLRFGIDGEADS